MMLYQLIAIDLSDGVEETEVGSYCDRFTFIVTNYV